MAKKNKKLSYYRDFESGKIRYGKAPKGHPFYDHDDLNYKKPLKGRVVEYQKHGSSEVEGGTVHCVGEHGLVVECKKGKKHKILHHEVKKQVAGKNADKYKILEKSKVSNQEARQYIPAMESIIAMIQEFAGSDRVELNTYKYRLQSLRNKILNGNSVDSQDIRDMQMTMSEIGKKLREGKKPLFVFRMK